LANQVGYADALHNGPFKGDEKALRALEQVDMISILHREGASRRLGSVFHFWSVALTKTVLTGHQAVIRPGKPVYRTAFERLASDRVFSATQELSINAASTSTSESTIKAISSELVELGHLFLGSSGKWAFGGTHGVPVEVAQRVDVLLKRMGVEEQKLVGLEKQAAELREVLHEK
jgi:hypothetical protein